MKICILSMQDVANIGSLLQAYALKQILTEEGNSVKFLHIQPIAEDNNLMTSVGYSFADEMGGSKNLFVRLKKLDRYSLYYIKNKKMEHTEAAIMDEFRKTYFTNASADEQFDLCIIGSDEVFNCTQPSPWGFTTQLFGNVPQARKVITYAACCGTTKDTDLTSAVKQRIKGSLSKLLALSVRDKNTFKFVKNITGRTDIEHHLDPVFITDFFKEISKSSVAGRLPEKYCIIYSYSNRIHNKEEIRNILTFCKRHKLVPICVGLGQKWISHTYALNPFEVLWTFKNASFVITDTFHGTIFSAKYAKKFAVIIRKSNENKLGDLVDTIEVRDHVLENGNTLENLYLLNNNFARIKAISDSERARSVSYLMKYLNQ